MKLVIGIIVAVVIFYYIFIKLGNLKFWQKAQRNPEVVYQHFLKSEYWHVDDGINTDNQPSRNSGKWEGPFPFIVPSIGKMVKVYGKVGFYEQDERDLESKLE